MGRSGHTAFAEPGAGSAGLCLGVQQNSRLDWQCQWYRNDRDTITKEKHWVPISSRNTTGEKTRPPRAARVSIIYPLGIPYENVLTSTAGHVKFFPDKSMAM